MKHRANGRIGTKINQSFLVIIFFALVFTPLLQADAAPKELLGRWRSTQISEGGLGSMLFFRADGTIEYSFGAVVEMAYRIENEELVFSPATVNGPEQRGKFKFSGKDQVTLLGKPGEVLTRKGEAPDQSLPILGEWEGTRDLSGHKVEARYLFYPSGKCLLLMPFIKKTLKNTIEGLNLRMERPDEEPLFGVFLIEDGILTLPGSSGDTYSRY